jgi:hypothetical protein
MANRIFVCAIVVLWLGSMSWLMVDKILPSFHEGTAPIAAGYESGVPVAWQVYWGERSVGHAASIRLPGVLNTTNIINRVVLENVPLLDLVPALMRRVVGDIGSMRFDARTELEFDSLDNFSSFKSRVSVNDVASVLQLSGRVNGSFLELKVHFGDVTYEPKVPIANQAALSEALFPDAKLPYMYVGRRWTEEVYNPFRAPSSPVETVDVAVTGIESIEFDGQQHKAMRVEFSGAPAPGVPEDALLQAIAWVRVSDGLVMRQDVLIASSRLRFERLSDEEAAEIGKNLRLVPGHGRRRGHGSYGGAWRGWREQEAARLNGERPDRDRDYHRRWREDRSSDGRPSHETPPAEAGAR